MKISVFLLSVLLIGFVSCKKEFHQKLQGQYEGVFIRTAPAIDYMPSKVNLTLNEETFTGNSEIPKYPAICSGSWNADKKKIRFANGCAWTADFDHTLILNGEFEYEWKGNTLYMRKTIGQVSDVYELQKQ